MATLNKNQKNTLQNAYLRAGLNFPIKAGERGCGVKSCEQLEEMGYLARRYSNSEYFFITESGKAALGISDEPQPAVAVETPAAQDSEYQPMVGDVVDIRYIFSASSAKWIRGTITFIYENGSIRTNTAWWTTDKLQDIRLVERPTSAPVAITDDSAVDNTPSEPKREIEQPSGAEIVIKDSVMEILQHILCNEENGWRPAAWMTEAQYQSIKTYRLVKVAKHANTGSKFVELTDKGREYLKGLQKEEAQPVSGWLADALQSVNVTTEAIAADDYLPPMANDNDDLPFSDLGEDETTSNENQYDSLLATLVKFAVNGKVASQRELALSLISTLHWHAMEVERELEELESEPDLFFGLGDGALDDTYAVLLDIHTANKNGALA